MPLPSVEPMPLDLSELRPAAPEDAHDASYFAASARMLSFSRRDRPDICSTYVLVGTSSKHDFCRMRNSDLVQVEVVVELAHGAGHAQVLCALDGREGAVHVLAQRLLEEAGGLRRLDCRQPVGRHLGAIGALAFVAVAGGLRAGVELFVEALRYACKNRCRNEIRVRIDAGRAVLDAAGTLRACRHAQGDRTVVDAPGRCDWRI